CRGLDCSAAIWIGTISDLVCRAAGNRFIKRGAMQSGPVFSAPRSRSGPRVIERQTALVSNDLTLETSCTDFRLCERRDDHGLSNTAERCSSGTANAGEVVAVGSSDPLDYAKVAEPTKLA